MKYLLKFPIFVGCYSCYVNIMLNLLITKKKKKSQVQYIKFIKANYILWMFNDY